MRPLYADDHFTFRCSDDRLVPRFHLEGVEPGCRVDVFRIDAATGERLGLLGSATVGAGGWVDLAEPLVVKAGDAFSAVPVAPPLIRPETAADRDAVRQVNRLAFGQDDEARLVDALRDGGHVRVSLVAEQAGRVMGHILFSDLPIATDAGTVPALALAPMAVLPEWQRRGIGSALVRRGLEACRDDGHRVVVVVGHPGFYPRFGFSPGKASRLASPFSGRDSFMAAELVAGALDGVAGRVQYTPPFGAWV